MNHQNPVNEGKLASAKGFANENRLLAALLERGYNASKVDLPLSAYDIIVEIAHNDTIRVQVKTISKTGRISFTGGSRGGVDREYRSGVKSYVQSTATSDIVVGVSSKKCNGDSEVNFYFVPTLYIEHIGQQSLSINKVPDAKNNWAILRYCKVRESVAMQFQCDLDSVTISTTQ